MARPYKKMGSSYCTANLSQETALLLNSSRNATVVCQSDCELLVIDKQDFIPMFATHVKSSTSHISGTYKDLDHLRYLRFVQFAAFNFICLINTIRLVFTA